MPLYEINSERIAALQKTTFEEVRIRERDDLQRLLRHQIEIVVPDGYVLAEEFADWDDSARRIDLLVMDKDANLVIVELKRTSDGGHMELQSLRYAAMISQMTWHQAAEAHRQFLQRIGIQEDPASRMLDFLGWSEPNEEQFAQEVRIVLAAADFSKEITTTVLWLNERALDVRCVRLVPYKYDDRTFLDIQQVIPLPEAEEYQIKVREKATHERIARLEHGSKAERNLRFWTQLLEKANAVSPLHAGVAPTKENWVAADAKGIRLGYVTSYDTARVELYLFRASKEENKAIFDDLYSHKAEVEATFGGPLEWRRLDDKNASRVYVEIPGGSPNDESTWDTLHAALIDGMQRFEAALRPYVDKYRKGEKPAVSTLDP